VAEFLRLCLFEETVLEHPGTRAKDRDNVTLDLDRSDKEIWAGYRHNVRNNVRKALRSGIHVRVDTEGRYLEEFLDVYDHTMRRRSAEQGGRRSREWIQRLVRNLPEQVTLIHAFYGGQVVSSELVVTSADTAYSFLGGTLVDCFDLQANSLVKHVVACWAKSEGKRRLVLGGGHESGDGIFRFKRAFAPDGVAPFYVVTRIHCPGLYRKLCERSKAVAGSRGGIAPSRQNTFFPAYRRP
jgi:lipid II:glycine glycyltransferase (peptidoglycan interpeptide bridge formation enzyme)